MTTIVTCPQCDTSFSIALAVLQPSGKRVRCTKCKHDWFQEPPSEDESETIAESTDEEDIPADHEDVVEEYPAESTDKAEETSEESAEHPSDEAAPEGFDDYNPNEFDEIPEGVKPVEGDDVKVAAKINYFSRDSLIGYGIAVVLLVLVIGVSIALRPVFIKDSLQAHAYYALFGFKPAIPAEKIIFTDISAKVKDDNLVVSGNLVNLSDHEIDVPYMLLNQLDENGAIIKTVMIEPPIHTLEAEGDEMFEVSYPAEEGAKTAKILFTLQTPEHADHDKPAEENHGKEEHKDAHKADEAKSSPEQPHAPEGHHSSPAH